MKCWEYQMERNGNGKMIIKLTFDFSLTLNFPKKHEICERDGCVWQLKSMNYWKWYQLFQWVDMQPKKIIKWFLAMTRFDKFSNFTRVHTFTEIYSYRDRERERKHFWTFFDWFSLNRDRNWIELLCKNTNINVPSHTKCNGIIFTSFFCRCLNFKKKNKKKSKWKVLATTVVCIMQVMVREATLRWYCWLSVVLYVVCIHRTKSGFYTINPQTLTAIPTQSLSRWINYIYMYSSLSLCVCVVCATIHTFSCLSLTHIALILRSFVHLTSHAPYSLHPRVNSVFDFERRLPQIMRFEAFYTNCISKVFKNKHWNEIEYMKIFGIQFDSVN